MFQSQILHKEEVEDEERAKEKRKHPRLEMCTLRLRLKRRLAPGRQKEKLLKKTSMMILMWKRKTSERRTLSDLELLYF